MHLNLAPRLTLIFVLFAALLMAGVGALAYFNGRAALYEATAAVLFTKSSEEAEALNAWIDDGVLDLATLAASPRVRDTVAVMVSATPDLPGTQDIHDRVVAELLPWSGLGHHFLTLFVIEAESGRVIAATDANEEGKFKEDRLYFINGRHDPYVQNPYHSLKTLGPAMTAAAPIRSAGGRLLGVLAGRLNLDAMNAIIDSHKDVRQTLDIYLVNTSNLFVTQPRFIDDPVVLQHGNYTEYVKHCLAGNSGTRLANDYRGVPVIVDYRWLPERQLCLVATLDQTEAFAPSNAFLQAIIFSGIVILLVATALAFGLARTITQPILALRAGVMRFGRGDLDYRIKTSAQDEIGQLASAMNEMAGHLRHSLGQTAHSQRLLLAISQAAQAVQRARTPAEVYRTVGDELAGLGYNNTIFILTDDRAHLVMTHLAFPQAGLVQAAEKLTGLTAQTFRLPLTPGGFYARIIAKGETSFFEHGAESITEALPGPVRPLAGQLVALLGIQQAIYAPLTIGGEVYGLLSITGAGLSEADVPAVTAFANQTAIALENARLYQAVQQQAEVLREYALQLEAANQELDAFSYSVSHDLRAPLRAIEGFSRILVEEHTAQLSDEAQHYLHLVRNNTLQMGRLIDDLLQFSRLSRQPLSQQTVSPADLARQALEDLRAEQDGRHVEIVIGDLPTCRADPILLKQVWVNLLSNALKFTRKRQVVRIEIGCAGQVANLTYYVKDNGVGFDMQYAHKLFGVFQRLHNAEEYEGTGVGLAIVQRIVHRHGGRVWAEAQVDRGATFYFSLGEGNP